MAISPRSRRLLPLLAVAVLVAGGAGVVLATRAGAGQTAAPAHTSPEGVAGATQPGSAPAGGTAPGSGTTASGSVCSTSTAGAESIVACVAGPAPGTEVSGSVDVWAKVTIRGQGAGIQRAVYQLDGAPVLTAFLNPYKFALDTAMWPDGSHRLTVLLTTRDGITTAPATMTLTFKNGTAAAAPRPADAQPFQPTSGRAGGGSFVVAAVGDGASGEKGETQTVNQIASWNPNLFLYLGDVYENGRPTEFDNWYGSASSQGVYGMFRPITDPTVGNHEYIGNDAPGYFGYWQGIGHYYSFDAGGWHFVSIDSNIQFAQLQPGTAQYDWLDHDLSAATSPCTVVYYHHPLYNVGPEKDAGQMTAVWALLAKHHVTMVLNGHDHDYQRWSPLDGTGAAAADGVTEFVVGSGGHGHQPQKDSDPRLAASDFHDFGALKLTLGSSSAAFQFVTASGSVADSGTVKCQGGQAGAAAGSAAASSGHGTAGLSFRLVPDATLPESGEFVGRPAA